MVPPLPIPPVVPPLPIPPVVPPLPILPAPLPPQPLQPPQVPPLVPLPAPPRVDGAPLVVEYPRDIRPPPPPVLGPRGRIIPDLAINERAAPGVQPGRTGSGRNVKPVVRYQ